MTTSAGRLLAILEKGESYRYVNADRRTEETIGRIWAKIVDVPLNDDIAISALHGQIVQLPEQIKGDLLRAQGAGASNFTGVLETVAKGLNNAKPSDQWHQIQAILTPSNKSGLHMADTILKINYAEPIIERTQLIAWKDQIGELIIEILDANIEEQLKRQLVELLEEFQLTILSYLIYGSRGIVKVSQRAFGLVLLRHHTHPDQSQTEIEVLSKVIGIAADIIQVVQGVPFIYNAIAPVFGLPQLPSGD